MPNFFSTRTLTFLTIACALAALLASCATRPVDQHAASADASTPKADAVPVFVDPRWPISVEDYRTTSEQVYLGNLDARISEYERAMSGNPPASVPNQLASALYHRFKIIGKVEDAERAMALLDDAVRQEPDEASHRVLRAIVRSAFHRFAEAEADLAVAAKSGAAPEISQQQREIDLALGRYDRLEAEFGTALPPTSDFYELVHRADLAVMQGDFDKVNVLMRAAQLEYRDVSPVPLAWLHVQRGIASLRFGDIASAKSFFASAHQRMPRYFLATEHLAEVETELRNFDVARKLYVDVIEQTGNPEFIAALAGLESAAGNKAETARLNAEAKSAFAALYARHPDAYAQHYAEFLLETGDVEKALELAERNIGLRQDVGSWILLAQAAEAAGRDERACEAFRRVGATGRSPPELVELHALARRCARAG